MGNSFFKYTTLDSAEKIITEKKLQFSRPSLFNDPFDMQIPIALDFHNLPVARMTQEREIQKRLNGDFGDPKEAISDLEKKITCSSNKEEIAIYKKIIVDLKENGKVTNPESLQYLRDNYNSLSESKKTEGAKSHVKMAERHKEEDQKAINELFIFCGSKKHNNILMWSHYSDSHKGIVLELNCRPSSFFKNMKEVQYASDRPPLDNIDTKFLHTKSELWKYEEEIRGVITESTTIPANQNTYLASYTSKDLLAIYFGANISKEEMNEEKVQTLIKRAEEVNPNIKFFKMSCDNLKYELNTSPIIRKNII